MLKNGIMGKTPLNHLYTSLMFEFLKLQICITCKISKIFKNASFLKVFSTGKDVKIGYLLQLKVIVP